ncbi:TetR/AcrR family transcriptional regulator [Ketobacter sp.]|uniref:TetR/AcrR family transcriptional regulator n=1 Tax=Ketobacter sp. TaxID=2083498 RepID=UPI0025BD7DC2|nr:TetR/AcrR family transcriptional regulator [Ketobacter sp.]
MVERLLEATATTLAERGLEDTTTNHIAETAGVSIGSLYQYFPDKEALLEALMERVSEKVANVFREHATQLGYVEFDLKSVTNYLILYGMNAIRNDALSLEIMRSWNSLPLERLLDPLEKFFLSMAQPYFVRHYQDYPIQHLEGKLYVIINSTLFTVVRYLRSAPNNTITEKKLAHILSDMIVAMLAPPPSA